MAYSYADPNESLHETTHGHTIVATTPSRKREACQNAVAEKKRLYEQLPKLWGKT